MAGSWESLRDELVDRLGAQRVYFQPSNNTELVYPCIIFSLTDRDRDFANGRHYKGLNRYMVTVIDYEPDGPVPDKVFGMRYCSFDRRYVSDNLYHDTFNIYY